MLHETYCSSVLKNDRYLLNEVIDHLLQLNCNQILIGIDATGKIFFSNNFAVNNLKIKSNNNLTEILPSIVPYLGEVINKLVCYFDLPIQINKFEFLAKLSPIILKNICMGVFCVFESSIKGFRYNQSIKSYCNLNPEADIIF